MFKAKKRPDEEPDVGKGPPSPQDLLAKEAAMAGKLLEDLIPEEPSKKPKDALSAETTVPTPPPRREEGSPETPPAPAGPARPPQEKPGEKLVEEVPVETKPLETAPVTPAKDELSETVERIHSLGVELVQIRNEILAARQKYADKTKELEGLQEKLKGLLGQIT